MSSLYSSNGSSDEDELSKLIGKRSQIKRQKAVDVEEAVKSLEPTVDLDLDKLPNFKTERPVRKNRPKRDEEKEESPKGKSQKEEESPIVDFMAEYEDEVRTYLIRPGMLLLRNSHTSRANKERLPRSQSYRCFHGLLG